MSSFEDAMKAEEKIVFLVEYLKSDQFYPEYCTEVGQALYFWTLRTTNIFLGFVWIIMECFKSYLNPLLQEWKN